MVRYYCDPLDPTRAITVKDPFISAGTYQEMVEKTPIPCTDVILTTPGNRAVYLARRSIYPMKGTWVLGGRIWFNDATLSDSVARCLEMETGQKVDPSRFKMLPTPHFYSWAVTRQGNFPGKNLAITFNLEATEDELSRIASGLTPEEYECEFGLQRFTRERLIDEQCHPALIDLYDEVFA